MQFTEIYLKSLKSEQIQNTYMALVNLLYFQRQWDQQCQPMVCSHYSTMV